MASASGPSRIRVTFKRKKYMIVYRETILISQTTFFFFFKRKEEGFWVGYGSFLRIIGPLAEAI
jgi:hypothetical protein